MKVTVTEGCVAYGITVDDKNINELNDEEKNAVIDKIAEFFKKRGACELASFLTDITQMYGEYEYLYHCDQCGDDVYEYKIDL